MRRKTGPYQRKFTIPEDGDMSFRRGGGKKRRDGNEAAIIQALKAVGCEVWQLSGDGLPDLLTRRQGVYLPLEVKTRTGRLQASQQGIPWPVVRSVDEALTAIGARIDG